MLVQMERQIDREIAADNKANNQTFGTQTDEEAQKTSTGTSCEEEFESDSEEDEDDGQCMLVYGPQPQIITNDLKSLDEMVSKVSNISLKSQLLRSKRNSIILYFNLQFYHLLYNLLFHGMMRIVKITFTTFVSNENFLYQQIHGLTVLNWNYMCVLCSQCDEKLERICSWFIELSIASWRVEDTHKRRMHCDCTHVFLFFVSECHFRQRTMSPMTLAKSWIWRRIRQRSEITSCITIPQFNCRQHRRRQLETFHELSISSKCTIVVHLLLLMA